MKTFRGHPVVDVVKEPIRPPPISGTTVMMAPQPTAVYNTFTDEVEEANEGKTIRIICFVAGFIIGWIIYAAF